MKVLLTGANGQLGQALRLQKPANVTLIATSRQGGGGCLALDLADAGACRAAVEQHRPDWVINAGAYTGVDRAEQEPELALAVNAGAPRAFAAAVRDYGGRLLQISTDFVFNGMQGSPYRIDQSRSPLGSYGRSKAAGEEAVETMLGDKGLGVILRTSWVMGPVGHNFALTMLRLHRERSGSGQHLAVVADQVGSPTSTTTLATACWQVLSLTEPPAILHWSDAGVASWYDVAVAVGELAEANGLLSSSALVQPITTADYPTPAQRPAYSVLDCSFSRRSLDPPATHWRTTLGLFLAAIN